MNRTLRSGALPLLCASLLGLILLPASATLTKMHNQTNTYADGAYPVGVLANNAGTLYGFTQYGPNGAGYGSFFKTTTKGTVTTLNTFVGGANSPYQPNAGPVLVNGKFYGTSINGGASNVGMVFEITTNGTLTVRHTFTGYNSGTPSASDGANPYSGLFYNPADGYLYGTTLYGGTKNNGTVYKIMPDGSNYSIIHSFDSAANCYYPYMAPCIGPDGMLYGTAYYCSGFNGGVYRLNTDSTGYSLVHGFGSNDPAGYNPFSDLVLNPSDNKLYGTCPSGTVNGVGSIFRVNTSGSGSVELVWAFDGLTGQGPGYPYATNPQSRLTVASGGIIYGVARGGGNYGYGTIFKLDTSTNTVTLVASLGMTSGLNSPNPLTLISSTLYGTTYYSGMSAQNGPFGSPNGVGATISSTTGGTLKLLHSWYTIDAYTLYDSPTAPISGYCYGASQYGGQYNWGAIYKIGSTGSFTYSVLHSFNNYNMEGINPRGGLFKAADGALYGCTEGGGLYGNGTIYKITTAGVFTVLHHFRAGQEGNIAYRKLTQGYGTDKNLYGICYGSGAGNYGCVFKMDTAGKNFQVIHYFTNLDGRNPGCQLTIEPDTGNNTTKWIYGLTAYGGANGLGTLFRMNTSGSSFTVLHDFASATGTQPGYFGGPMALVSGVLYGVAPFGGANGHGVVFSCNTTTNAYTLLRSFNNGAGDGYYPYGGLTTDNSGNFFGTNTYGGSGGYGTVWKYNPGTNTLTILHSFTGQPGSGDGAYAEGGVMYDSSSGLLFGSTLNGGTANYGTIFNQTTVP